MSRPSQSVAGWASGGVIATSIPPAEVALGQQTADPVPAAWINLFGAWIGYIEGFTPSDGVWTFREWECPDNAAFSLEWSGSTDGLLEGTLDAMQIAVSDTSFVQYISGPELSYWSLTSGGIQVATNLTGGTARVFTSDPTTPGDTAGLTVDVDSGDVTLASDYGLITIGTASDTISVPGNISTGQVAADRYRYQSATTFFRAMTPTHYADVDGSAANDVAAGFKAGWAVADPGGLADGDVLCWALLGGLEPAVYSSATPTLARLFWSVVLGGDGITIELVSVSAGGTETVVASADLPDGTSGDQSTDLTLIAASIQVSETYFLRASSKGGATTTIKVYGLRLEYTRMDAR